MINRFFIVVTIAFLTLAVKGQELPADSLRMDDFDILTRVIRDGDTLLHSNIREVSVYPVPQFSSRREFRRYDRLVYNLKVVYPYAVLAAEMLNDMNQVFLTLKTEKEQKEYVKKVEKELMNEFEDDLKSLTLTQGRLLIKLIDRETGAPLMS
jgi:hypothetical protein